MSSSYRKINANSVQYGESFVLSGSTEQETVDNLTAQKKSIQNEIEKAKAELSALKDSMKDLFLQRDNMIADAQKEVEEIKAKAILDAENIISDANAQKDNITAEAVAAGQKQGFEAGYNDGLDNFKNEYKNHLESLNLLVNTSFQVKNEIIFSSETEILELALLIAEKVTSVKFENDIEVFKNMIQTALSLLKEKENVRIVVNPKLIDYANEISSELSSKINDFEQIKIIQDKSVKPDGAVVESVDSRIDATISRQLEILAGKLLIDNRQHDVLTEEVEEKINSKIKKQKKND